MLNNFAFPFCLFYFSLKPKPHKLKPIYFFLRQMSQPLHWGLNGFHSAQMVKMPVLLGYFSSLRSTSCCQVRSQRFGKRSNGVLGGWGRWFYWSSISSSSVMKKRARPAMSLDSESPGWDERRARWLFFPTGNAASILRFTSKGTGERGCQGPFRMLQ